MNPALIAVIVFVIAALIIGIADGGIRGAGDSGKSHK